MRQTMKWLAMSSAVAAVLTGSPLFARLDDEPDANNATPAMPTAGQTDDAKPTRADGRPGSRPSGSWRYGERGAERGSRDSNREGGKDGGRENAREGGREGGGNGGGGGGGNGGGRELVQATPEEWEEIVKFMDKSTPVRLDLYRKVEAEFGPDRWPARVLRSRIIGRYRDLQLMQERNPEMHQFAFKQMQIEDAVLGTLIAQRAEGENPELAAKLDEQMRSFVDNYLNERAAKLNKLKELVSKEEANLARDQANVAEMVVRQTERFKKDMDRMLDFAAKVDGRDPTTTPLK